MTLEREIFAREVDARLTMSEQLIMLAAAPALERLLQRMDRLVAAGDPISDSDLEALTAELNDTLSRTIGEQLAAQQGAMAALAARWAPTQRTSPHGAAYWLERASIDGHTLAAYFRRRSPSLFMGALMDQLRKGIEAGWTRHRASTAAAAQRLVATVAETAVWSGSGIQMAAAWNVSEFIFYTRLDEKVCKICGPKHGTRYSGASNGPPAHPRCRCVGLPAVRA